MRILQFFNISRVWLFEIFFCILSHLGLYTIQEHLGKYTLVAIWFYNGVDSYVNLDIQRFSHLVIPIKYQYVTDLTVFDTRWEVL